MSKPSWEYFERKKEGVLDLVYRKKKPWKGRNEWIFHRVFQTKKLKLQFAKSETVLHVVLGKVMSCLTLREKISVERVCRDFQNVLLWNSRSYVGLTSYEFDRDQKNQMSSTRKRVQGVKNKSMGKYYDVVHHNVMKFFRRTKFQRFCYLERIDFCETLWSIYFAVLKMKARMSTKYRSVKSVAPNVVRIGERAWRRVDGKREYYIPNLDIDRTVSHLGTVTQGSDPTFQKFVIDIMATYFPKIESLDLGMCRNKVEYNAIIGVAPLQKLVLNVRAASSSIRKSVLSWNTVRVLELIPGPLQRNKHMYDDQFLYVLRCFPSLEVLKVWLSGTKLSVSIIQEKHYPIFSSLKKLWMLVDGKSRGVAIRYLKNFKRLNEVILTVDKVHYEEQNNMEYYLVDFINGSKSFKTLEVLCLRVDFPLTHKFIGSICSKFGNLKLLDLVQPKQKKTLDRLSQRYVFSWLDNDLAISPGDFSPSDLICITRTHQTYVFGHDVIRSSFFKSGMITQEENFVTNLEYFAQRYRKRINVDKKKYLRDLSLFYYGKRGSLFKDIYLPMLGEASISVNSSDFTFQNDTIRKLTLRIRYNSSSSQKCVVKIFLKTKSLKILTFPGARKNSVMLNLHSREMTCFVCNMVYKEVEIVAPKLSTLGLQIKSSVKMKIKSERNLAILCQDSFLGEIKVDDLEVGGVDSLRIESVKTFDLKKISTFLRNFSPSGGELFVENSRNTVWDLSFVKHHFSEDETNNKILQQKIEDFRLKRILFITKLNIQWGKGGKNVPLELSYAMPFVKRFRAREACEAGNKLEGLIKKWKYLRSLKFIGPLSLKTAQRIINDNNLKSFRFLEDQPRNVMWSKSFFSSGKLQKLHIGRNIRRRYGYHRSLGGTVPIEVGTSLKKLIVEIPCRLFSESKKSVLESVVHKYHQYSSSQIIQTLGNYHSLFSNLISVGMSTNKQESELKALVERWNTFYVYKTI